MTKKYYIISDIHGHYIEMISALEKNGYDSNNLQHHLIVIGDLFDRGTQSKEVLEHLHGLSTVGKATVILGNHESFLIELLDKKFLSAIFNIKHNGTDKTISSLIGRKYILNESLEDIRIDIIKKYPYLSEWLKSLPPYIELGKYIFVHGGIDGLNENWRQGTTREFTWNRQLNLGHVEGKIMVVGHHRAATIRYPKTKYKSLFNTNPEAFEVLYQDNKFFIDSFVEVSKFINVLILNI